MKNSFNIAVIDGAIGLDGIDDFSKDEAAGSRCEIAQEFRPNADEPFEKYNVPELVTDYKELYANIDVISIACPIPPPAPVHTKDVAKTSKNAVIDNNSTNARRTKLVNRKGGNWR